MLGDPIGIFVGCILADPLAVWSDHADLAIVEVDLVVLVHQADGVGVMRVDIAQDQIQVGLVAQHDIVEQLQAELGEFDRPAADLLRSPGAVPR